MGRVLCAYRGRDGTIRVAARHRAQRVEAVVCGRPDLPAFTGTTRVLRGDGRDLGADWGRAGLVSATALASPRSGAAGRARGVWARAAGGLFCLSALVATFASCMTSRLAAMAEPTRRKPSRKRRACHGVTTSLRTAAHNDESHSGWLRESVSETLRQGRFAGRRRAGGRNGHGKRAATAEYGEQRVTAGEQNRTPLFMINWCLPASIDPAQDVPRRARVGFVRCS